MATAVITMMEESNPDSDEEKGNCKTQGEQNAQDCDGNDHNDESNERNGHQDSDEEEDGRKYTNSLSDKQNLQANDEGSIVV